MTRNILHCLDHGTQLGWLIDPQEQSILIYFQSQQFAFFEAAIDVLPVPDFAKAFELTLGELFDWLLEREFGISSNPYQMVKGANCFSQMNSGT